MGGVEVRVTRSGIGGHRNITELDCFSGAIRIQGHLIVVVLEQSCYKCGDRGAWKLRLGLDRIVEESQLTHTVNVLDVLHIGLNLPYLSGEKERIVSIKGHHRLSYLQMVKMRMVGVNVKLQHTRIVERQLQPDIAKGVPGISRIIEVVIVIIYFYKVHYKLPFL